MDDYAYINARIRAMRADLLDQRNYEELMGAQDVAGICECLGRTVYGKGLGEEKTAVSLPAIEDWLRGEWGRIVRKLYQIADGQPEELLEILLGRWDVESIKSILRGKKSDIGISEILRTVLSTGVFDETALAELARQPSIQAVVDLLSTWRSPYAKPLKTAMRGDRELKGTEPLELALDHYYYEEAVRRLKGRDPDSMQVRRLLGFFIDQTNLLTAFKISREGVSSRAEISNYFIQGGEHLPMSVYDTIIRAQSETGGLREIVDALRKTPYVDRVEGLEREQSVIPLPVRLERRLDQFILERARAMGSSDPLGIGMIITYLLQKYHEICNIRMVLKARAYGLYPEDTRSLLVM